MAGDIFYSQVDENLAHELNARAAAGFFTKLNKSVDFMLSKMTNIEVSAYRTALIDSSTNLVRQSESEDINRFAVLGGKTTRQESYTPSSQTGYLTDSRPANRIPPVITLAEINYGDHSMGLLNNAAINVSISDPTADLEEFEKVWFRPGRHVSVKILGHNDSIISNGETNGKFMPQNAFNIPIPETYGLLKPPKSRTYDELKEKYGTTAKDREYADRKMNEVFFTGVIVAFTFSYQIDGTVEASIQMKGTSNVYTDVTLLLPKADDSTHSNSDNTQIESNEPNTLSKFIDTFVNNRIAGLERKTVELNDEIILTDLGEDRKDLRILVGELFIEGFGYMVDESLSEAQQAEERQNLRNEKILKNQYKYITLGLLIHLLNQNIIAKLNTTSTIDKEQAATLNAEIICNDDVCLGSAYKFLVSKDPTKVLLWHGTTDSDTDNYPDIDVALPYNMGTEEDPAIVDVEYFPQRMMPNVSPAGPGFQVGDLTFPSRIYLEVEHIRDILDSADILDVNSFLKEISKLIYAHTGGAIKMSLVTDPLAQDKLLYYNSNFIGTTDSIKAVNVNPFIIPMSAKDNLDDSSSKLIGSIVIDAKITSKLPSGLQSLAYVLNQGTDISKSKISPFVTFMYADGSVTDENTQRGKLAAAYTQKHLESIDSLRQAKALLTNDYVDNENHARLSDALFKYIQYPTPNITDSNVLDAPIYPFDAEITIEGIQGFRYGDVVILPVLPSRYRTQAVFSIINVNHTVDSAGVWQTKLKLVMRPKVE